jgi:hypothetical protein
VGAVAAANILAAAVSICVDCASAEDAPAGREIRTLLLFAGTDIWRHGEFVYGGLIWSPAGLDASGFTLKVLVGGGLYRYQAGLEDPVDVNARHMFAAVMPGWRFKRSGLEVSVYAGLDAQDHRSSPEDPFASLRGRYRGARGAFDLWYEPTPTTMLAASASVSTIGSGSSARAAFGVNLSGRFYLGPEAQALDCAGYQEYRLGLHVTALRTGWFEWSGGVGWTRDTDAREGLYGRFGVLTRP